MPAGGVAAGRQDAHAQTGRDEPPGGMRILAFEGDPGPETRLPEQGVGQRAHAVPRPHGHEGLLPDLLESGAPALRQPVPVMHHQAQRLAVQRRRGDRPAGRRDGAVRATSASPAASSARQPSLEPWLRSNAVCGWRLRKALISSGSIASPKVCWKVTAIRPRTTSDSCRTRSSPAWNSAKRRLDVRQERLGGGRQAHPAPVADQQFGAHDGAGPRDPPADRRLRQPQHFGRRRDVLGAAELGQQGQERQQLHELSVLHVHDVRLPNSFRYSALILCKSCIGSMALDKPNLGRCHPLPAAVPPLQRIRLARTRFRAALGGACRRARRPTGGSSPA